MSSLRVRGLPVGIRAELDLGRAFAVLPTWTDSAFRDACRATLAKSPEDLELLEEAFASAESNIRVRDIPERPAAALPKVSESPRIVVGPSGAPPMVIDATGSVRLGTYSRNAPPTSHPLRMMDGKQLASLRAGARRFRRIVATLPGRRFGASSSGRIDFRATVRSSTRHGGEWIDLRRRRRKPARSELAVLWDVSGSMREHDSTLFSLVYALLRANRRAHVLAFSTALHDFTGRIRGRSYAEAARAVAASLVVAGGGTQIAHCLEEFGRRHGLHIHERTTVVILSDGWDLGETNALRRTLRDLRRRAGLLVWVNPYARRPGFRPETAAMAEAMQFVDAMLGPEDFSSLRPLPPVVSRSSSPASLGEVF